MMNTNLGAKDLTNIVKTYPSILNGIIAHSQGTIKLVQVLKELNKTPEGRKIIKDNAKTIALAGPAVGPKELKEIENIVGKDKVKILNNDGDILNYMTGNEVTTSGDNNHAVKNYNINSVYDEKEKKYIRPDELQYEIKDKEGNPIYDKNGNIIKGNILGKIEKINGENTQSIFQQKLGNTLKKNNRN